MCWDCSPSNITSKSVHLIYSVTSTPICQIMTILHEPPLLALCDVTGGDVSDV